MGSTTRFLTIGASGLLAANALAATVGTGTVSLTGTIRDFHGVNATSTGGGISTHPDFDQFNFGPLLDLQDKVTAGTATFTDVQNVINSGVPVEYLPTSVDNLPAFPPVFPGGTFNIPGAQDQTHKVEPGIVNTQLGGDNKPVYAGGSDASLHKSTSNAANFNQWWNDTTGVNLSTQHTITLKDIGNGISSFESSRTSDAGTGIGDDGTSDGGFFPIDNQLGGNDGVDRSNNPHNFSFTFEIHDNVTYKAGSGQTFDFTGDDDVWVFLKDQLVIDLGGVHNELSKSINLDNLASQLNLTDGEQVKFDFFYAERNQFNSDIKIQTSFFGTSEGGGDGGGGGGGDGGGGGGDGGGAAVPLPPAAWTGLGMFALGAISKLRRLRAQ
jgi:fibro-slime domain-containing protein